MKRLLIVVDYQNDFVDGSLGFKEAKNLESQIVKLIREYKSRNDEVIYTMDTHKNDYMKTYEGKNLPIEHCIENTDGWELYGETKNLLKDCLCFKKETFPSLDLGNYLKDKQYADITIVGLVSHICVISNAVICKAAQPNIPIYIDLSATSSVDNETHKKCIDVMKSMQFEFINE